MPDLQRAAVVSYLRYRLRNVSRPVLGMFGFTLLVDTLLAAWITSYTGFDNFILVALLHFLGFLLFVGGLNKPAISGRWFNPRHFHSLLFFGFFLGHVFSIFAIINWFSLRNAKVGYAASPAGVSQLLNQDPDFYSIKRAWLAYDHSTLYMLDEGKSNRYRITELTPVVDGPADTVLRAGPVRCWLAEDILSVGKNSYSRTQADSVLPLRQVATNETLLYRYRNATMQQREALLQYAMQPWLAQYRASVQRSPRWVSSLCLAAGGRLRPWQDTSGVYRLLPADNRMVQGTEARLPSEEMQEAGWGSIAWPVLSGAGLLLFLTLLPLSKTKPANP